MTGYRTRFRENDDLPLWRGPAVKKKPPFLNLRDDYLRVKLCAVEMRNAALGNDLKLHATTFVPYINLAPSCDVLWKIW